LRSQSRIATLRSKTPEWLESREDHFFIAMAVSMALVVFAGFAESFYLSHWLDPLPKTPTNPVFYFHGSVFTAWMVLLIAQTALIAMGRVAYHRRLGVLGIAIAIGVIVTGVYALLEAASPPIGSANPPKDLAFVGVILVGICMFALLVGIAIAYRRKPQYHKRLMLLATVNLLQAAIVRIPISLPGCGLAKTFLYADLFILPMVAWDIVVLKRVHPATLWGGLAIVVSLPVRYWISETELWLSTARWAVDLFN
jgi:hypothetical protein